MKRNNFLIRSHCQLTITSQEIDPKTISNLLKIEPSSAYAKGDSFLSRSSGQEGKRFQNLWSINSNTITSEKENLTPHIIYFKSLLENKLVTLNSFKNNPQYDVSFWIWIETENVGIGIDLSEIEISFITSISSRVHFSILANCSEFR